MRSVSSPPIKESEIIDFFLGAPLKEGALKRMSKQKLTCAGRRTRSRPLWPQGTTMDMLAWVLSAPRRGHPWGHHLVIKLSIVIVQGGYWGSKMRKPLTVPCKVTSRCGSVPVGSSHPSLGTLALSQEAAADGQYRRLLHRGQGLC